MADDHLLAWQEPRKKHRMVIRWKAGRKSRYTSELDTCFFFRFRAVLLVARNYEDFLNFFKNTTKIKDDRI